MTTIYLSSTYEDLKDYRRAVYEALRKAGHQVIAMEDYGAADQRPVDKCLKDVEDSDIYVGLFAFRYGYIPPPHHGNPNGLSITELEFRHAEALKKPCLTFVVNDATAWPRVFDDANTAEDKGERIKALRGHLLTKKLASQFSSPHELSTLVLAAVTQYLAPAKQTEPTTVWPESAKILISYRREDSAGVTGRIYDRLVQEFGREAVFKDVDSIPIGIDFRTYLDEQIAKCNVCIVVIGRKWIKEQSSKGKSRFNDPGDFVRIEIESALKRQILVIPVLVNGATLPPADWLPAGMQDLSYRHGIAVRPDHNFHRDMDLLINGIRRRQLPDERTTSKTSYEAVKPSHPRRQEEHGSPKTGPGRGLAWTPWIWQGLRVSSLVGALGLILVGAWFLSQSGLRELNASAEAQPASTVCQTLDGMGPEMIIVPPGSFQMGGTNENEHNTESPRHLVAIRTVGMSTCEITFEEYDRFAQATGRLLPSDSGWGRGRRPAIHVSWEDAKAYADWLSQQTGKRYRLPTEAEWEYAARSGGKEETWAGTSDEKQLADFSVFYAMQTALVGGKKPNALGLHDMSGNVWEWVEDCWHGDYQEAPTDGSAWLEANGGACGRRVARGGSWFNWPVFLRTSYRTRYFTDFRYNFLGFRLVQDIP